VARELARRIEANAADAEDAREAVNILHELCIRAGEGSR
jgi:hypothetical protein